MDVEDSSLVETMNTFTKLEPLKALLFANSVWGEHQELLCTRDNFWRNSLHGLNRHNVDMYNLEFESIDEVKIKVHPTISDLQYLRSFKFDDLTFRGTIEFRSICEQPVGEIMASGAFHAGLMENLHRLTEVLEQDHTIYHKGYNASELRRMFVRRELPDTFDWKKVSELLTQILEIAKEGLGMRGFGEECFLRPLYPRAEKLRSPAREMVEGLEKGKTMDDYIEEYGNLNAAY